MLPGHLRYGDIMYEWDERGQLTITRQSTMEHVQLSTTEIAVLLHVIDFRGTGSAKPIPTEPVAS